MSFFINSFSLKISKAFITFMVFMTFTLSSSLAVEELETNATELKAEECNPITEKACVDYSEKIIDGFTVSRCWKYEQKHRCIGQEQNHCSTFEDNRGCTEIDGECKESTDLGICKNFEKKFVCGRKLEERAETQLIDTEFKLIKDEKDLSNCSEQEINTNCEIVEETCTQGKQTRNINGKEVTKDCWKWDRKYICKTDTYIDEYKELKEKEKCKEISRECLHEENGRCEHYEVKYSCTEEAIKSIDCIASQFCIGGVCETKKRKKHNDFGQSISYLSVLANMKFSEFEGCKCPNGQKSCNPSEIDTSTCKFFKGENGRCLRHTGSHNCCSDKGFLRQAFGCSDQEKNLAKLRKAKLCHHVHSWKGKGLNRFKKWQSYCCFKSKLARIIQVEGRKQLGIGWGDLKSPDCQGLSLDEIRRIDFSKINFGEIFDEVRSKATAISATKKVELQSKVQNIQDNPAQMSELLGKKISKFYNDARD